MKGFFKKNKKKKKDLIKNEDVKTSIQNNEAFVEAKLLAFCRPNSDNVVKVLSESHQASGLTFDYAGKPKILTETTLTIYKYIKNLVFYARHDIVILINGVSLKQILES
jgi:hypothetical protein